MQSLIVPGTIATSNDPRNNATAIIASIFRLAFVFTSSQLKLIISPVVFVSADPKMALPFGNRTPSQPPASTHSLL